MNSAQRKSAPCPERFYELISENHCACVSTGDITRLVASGQSLPFGSMPSAFDLLRWRHFNTVSCSVSAMRPACAILRPLYSAFQPPACHRPVEFSKASSRKNRIGFSGDDPSGLPPSGLSSSGLVIDYASESPVFGLRRCNSASTALIPD